jgi:Pin2-interacting protein X1
MIYSKRKVGLDPNNTKWARNTDSFGQKILRAQGWEPGQYLGAKDAPHAQWHTSASASHIRVILKEDNLGLGAKRNMGDHCTGLNEFQDLLGRLNGKTDETLETERRAREDVQLSLYVERKLGSMRFVKGGWLVGDQVQENLEESREDAKSTSSQPTKEESKKRSSESETESADEDRAKRRKLDIEKESRKREKKKRKQAITEDGMDEKSSKALKKEKKSKRKAEDQAEGPIQPSRSSDMTEAGSTSEESVDPEEAESTTRSKRDKKEKKKGKKGNSESTEREKKRSKKKQKRNEDEASSGTDAEDIKTGTSDTGSKQHISTTSSPSGSGYSTPIRHLSRQRFIAQKRMAFSDPAALKQVSNHT